MRIVVTGAGGGLGRAFCDVVPAHHELSALDHAALDVGDHASVMQRLVPLAPEAIVNLAAFTKVDACETEPERAYRDNATAPHNLALAARACGSTLLHVSTDYVFAGDKGVPYDELDLPRPVSVYGRSKLGGEERVRATLAEHVIVRTGFVFGGGKDFLSAATRRLRAGDEAGGLEDRVGSPTYVHDLAARLIPLLLTGRFGTYHLCGPEPTTWFDVLGRIARLGDLPGEPRPQRSEDLALTAPRPRDSSLSSVFVGELGIEPMPELDDSLVEFLRRLD